MTMESCSRCGKLFHRVGTNKICDDCKDMEKEYFETVKNFLRENPNKTMIEISYETGIDEDIILEFLRKGRLESAGYSISYPCSDCGAPISRGELCPKCSGTISETLDDIKHDLSSSTMDDSNKSNMTFKSKRSLARSKEKPSSAGGQKFKVVKKIGPDGKLKIEKVPIDA